MTRSEAAKKGQAALRRKLGKDYSKHMREIGKLGFQATILALAERQNIPVDLNYNPYKNLLRNLINKKPK